MAKFSSPKIRSKSWNKGCVQPSIFQPNLHQIQQSGGFSESSGHADSKTVIEIQDWPRFHGEKDKLWETGSDHVHRPTVYLFFDNSENPPKF